jgi:uncharacterized protein
VTFPLPQISTAILKVASRCNLDCTYCYVYHGADDGWSSQPPYMTDAVLDAALAALQRHVERTGGTIDLLFHGGEPLLWGQNRFVRAADRSRSILGDSLRGLTVQTNGVLIDKSWAELFRDHRIGVSVSIDGPEAIHDASRVDRGGKGTYWRVVGGVRHLQAAGIDPNVLCVVNPGSSGLDVYRELLAIGVKRFDFLLPDVTHDNKTLLYGHLGPHPVADYLLPIFDAWLDADDPSVDVRILQNLLIVVMGGRSLIDSFGNRPLRYVVIETDGSIDGLDILKTCEPGLTQTGLSVFRHEIDDLASVDALSARATTVGFPLPEACRSCREVKTCAGGYAPHRFSRRRGFDNPSVWCADLLLLLDRARAVAGAQTVG